MALIKLRSYAKVDGKALLLVQFLQDERTGHTIRVTKTMRDIFAPRLTVKANRPKPSPTASRG